MIAPLLCIVIGAFIGRTVADIVCFNQPASYAMLTVEVAALTAVIL